LNMTPISFQPSLLPGKGVPLAKMIGSLWAPGEKATVLLILIWRANQTGLPVSDKEFNLQNLIFQRAKMAAYSSLKASDTYDSLYY